jgi:hypothetical protein
VEVVVVVVEVVFVVDVVAVLDEVDDVLVEVVVWQTCIEVITLNVTQY